MTQAENFTVEIKRRIKAPRERVFDAFTIPDQILKWIGPKDCDGLSAKVDLRVGGEYRFRIDTDTHGEVEASGVFREIKRPSRLVYTWRWSDPRLDVGGTLVTVDFVDVNDATDVRFRHEGLPTIEDRDGHNDGWNLSFDKLEKLFSK
jgi:glutathione S-transferase